MMELTPSLVLALWAAGLAAGGAIVAWWRVVGPGYVWLVTVSVAMFGVFAGVAGGGPLAWLGVVAAVGAIVVRRTATWTTAAFAVSALLFAVVAMADSPAIPVATGALFIGGITSEMSLGHWYLVDPTLPRWALQRLILVGAVGLVADVAWFLFDGVLSGDDLVMRWAFVALAVMTALLTTGVWFSLKEPSYTGVMAATGLSYLGTLTAIGALVVARIVVSG